MTEMYTIEGGQKMSSLEGQPFRKKWHHCLCINENNQCNLNDNIVDIYLVSYSHRNKALEST